MKVWLGFSLLALGLFLVFSDLFLAIWTWQAHGQPDIIARGSFLLILLSPYVAALVALICIGVAVMARARLGQMWPTIGVALLIVAATYVILYLDHTATVWRLLGSIRLAIGSPGYTILSVACLALGASTIAHRPRRETDHKAAV